MIDAVDDYIFVDPSAVMVDGGIMPLRNGTGKSAKRCLRGEDVAFLLEKRLEGFAATGYHTSPSQTRIVFSRRIDSGVLDEVKAWPSLPSGFVFVPTGGLQPASRIGGGAPDRSWMMEAYAGVMHDLSSADFAEIGRQRIGSGLSRSNMEDLFDDYAKLRQYVPVYNVSNSFNTITSSHSAYGSVVDYSNNDAQSAVLWNNGVIIHVADGQWSGFGSWRNYGTKRLVAASASATVRCDMAKTCDHVIVALETKNTGLGAAAGHDGEWTDFFPLVPEKSGNEWMVGTDSIIGAARMCPALHGITLHEFTSTETGSSSDYQSFSVRITGVYGVFTIRDRCRWDVPYSE